jgi:putative membrane protein insertion efficiency factor|uniref:Putative membrane protein insertion efficiency factor n=1 Tax=candidate division WOR-3 bacterium TaxID=2052148 RepID=A0A7C6EAN1_UNCW3
MRNLIIFFIRSYQLLISPLLPGACRFYPSCSEYSIQAFRQYGIRQGLFLTVKRVLRCNPFCVGGYDPIPGPKEKRTNG